MRNKLFYFVGTAFLLCQTGMFTSCINGVDDEYLEQRLSGNEGGTGEEEENTLPDLNGDYFAGSDNELKMTYNGEELTGKKVNFAADDTNETAIIELSGMEKDLSSLTNGLLEFKFTTYSPIPGEKTIVLNNVKLYGNGSDYVFEGEDVRPTYTMTYKGRIQEGKMSIDITNTLTKDLLAGTWKLKTSDPIYLKWDTEIKLNLGNVKDLIGISLTLNQKPEGIWNLAKMFVKPVAGLTIPKLISNLLQSVTAEQSGGMYATYSYSEDITTPQWSSDMSRNLMRYYYGEEANRLYIEANADFIVNAVGGLVGAATRGSADPEETKAIGKELLAVLTPALEQGIPCTYELNEEKGTMAFYIDGAFVLEILQKLAKLGNDPIANEFVLNFLHNDESLKPYANILEGVIGQLPYLVTYKSATKYEGVETAQRPVDPTGECKFVKFGLNLTK